jgi:PqqD family protein of HPr-rel-A system
VWRADSRSIAYREWDDELVVFNEATGHTHQLDPFGRTVLLALLARPDGLRIPEIAAFLADATEEPEAAVPAIERTLGELADLELIACIPGSPSGRCRGPSSSTG